MATLISTYDEAVQIAKAAGMKVAMQSKVDGPYVFVNKQDLISIIKKEMEDNPEKLGPTDYDGSIDEWFVDNGVLHIPCGSF